MAGGTVIRDWLLGWIGSERLEDSTRDRLGRILGRRPAADTGFFDAVGDRWDQLRIDAFGRAFHFEAFTALLPGDWVVADVGCGTGYLLGWLSERFSKVIAVDPAASMLEVARNRPELKQAQNVDFREGSLADLPIDDSEVDLVIASLVLHHMADPTVAMPELRRCLKAAGTLMIIEQEVHDNELFRDRMGDERWGLDPQMLGQWASRTGFSEIHIIPLSTAEPTKRDIGRTPGLFILTATSGKPKVVRTTRVRKVRVKPGTGKARPHRPAKPEPDVITGVETQMDVHLL
jgi:ArsR family transcriptional regulator